MVAQAFEETFGIKVLEGTENRIVFIGMDQKRDELLYSNVKGKNPFKDKRVREALSIAGAMSPCVLWMDEIEKGIAGDSGGTAVEVYPENQVLVPGRGAAGGAPSPGGCTIPTGRASRTATDGRHSTGTAPSYPNG